MGTRPVAEIIGVSIIVASASIVTIVGVSNGFNGSAIAGYFGLVGLVTGFYLRRARSRRRGKGD